MASDIAHDLRVEKWRQIILEANNSDIPKIQYMREHNLSENSFYYWQRFFRKEAIENGTALSAIPQNQPVNERSAAPGQQVSSFIEVTAPSVPDPAPSAPAAPCTVPDSEPDSSWTMMLRHGDYSLYLDNSVSEKCLKTVLRAIPHA